VRESGAASGDASPRLRASAVGPPQPLPDACSPDRPPTGPPPARDLAPRAPNRASLHAQGGAVSADATLLHVLGRATSQLTPRSCTRTPAPSPLRRSLGSAPPRRRPPRRALARPPRAPRANAAIPHTFWLPAALRPRSLPATSPLVSLQSNPLQAHARIPQPPPRDPGHRLHHPYTLPLFFAFTPLRKFQVAPISSPTGGPPGSRPFCFHGRTSSIQEVFP
jgi:hypothetical protein